MVGFLFQAIFMVGYIFLSSSQCGFDSTRSSWAAFYFRRSSRSAFYSCPLAAISVIILAPYFLLLNLLIASLPDSLLSFTVWIGGVVVGVVMWIVLGFRVARQLIKDAESHSAGKYSLIGVQDAGPCTIEELKALLVSGKVDRETLCFRGGSPSLSVFAWPVSLRQLIDG